MSTLKAPKVREYISQLEKVSYRSSDYRCAYDTNSRELLDELFALLREITPTGDGRAWSFWIKADRGTIEDYGNYEELLEDGEVESYAEFEQCWRREYPDEVEWFHFQAVCREDINYRSVYLHHRIVIEQDERTGSGFERDISQFVRWLVDQVKEVISELEAGNYNMRIQRDLPKKHRVGTVLGKYEWEVYPYVREAIRGNLTDEDIGYFLVHAKSDLDNRELRLPVMTANDFYRYCAMGYEACGYNGTAKTPQEQYFLHADGRDDGLSDIDPDSSEALADWYHNRSQRGGHPWEVCRGGNSTHVSLYVVRDEQGWSLHVAGSARTRCAEAVQFFLALHRAGIPVCIRQADILKNRLLGEEKIGIVPVGVVPRYCDNWFPDENIIDFINLPHENEPRDKLLPHCIWQPLDMVELNQGQAEH